MLAVRLEPAIEAELTKLALETGRSKSYYVKEALAEYLLDRADYLRAIAALERQEPRTSMADVRAELGLSRWRLSALTVWRVEFLATAKRELKKLDKRWQLAILDYLEDEIAGLENPRNRGKALVGDKQGLWRYRVADYHIICEIHDTKLLIIAVTIGHRKNVYD